MNKVSARISAQILKCKCRIQLPNKVQKWITENDKCLSFPPKQNLRQGLMSRGFIRGGGPEKQEWGKGVKTRQLKGVLIKLVSTVGSR